MLHLPPVTPFSYTKSYPALAPVMETSTGYLVAHDNGIMGGKCNRTYSK